MPYLVIAAIYLCGLASYSVDIVNKNIKNDQNKTCYKSDNDLFLDGDYILLDNEYTCITDNIYYSSDKESIYTSYIKSIRWCIFYTQIKENNYKHSIFSRPPPYLL